MFYVGLFFLLNSSHLLAQKETSTGPSRIPLWEKAKRLEKKGSYLKAKEVYDSLLGQEDLGDKRNVIQKEYEALNIKIIYSLLETSDSFMYEVAPGDTLSEIAKKNGTTIELLKRSNSLTSIDKITAGKKLKVIKNKFSILIEKNKNRLTLLSNGKPVKRYKVATGVKGSTPTGTFKIINKLENPTWFHAGQIISPEDPHNIIGSRWLGFDKPSYGIHGTTLPKSGVEPIKPTDFSIMCIEPPFPLLNPFARPKSSHTRARKLPPFAR